MKPSLEYVSAFIPDPFSALGRAVWDETFFRAEWDRLSTSFSALGRAVWDETGIGTAQDEGAIALSVLSVEPYGMKHLPPGPEAVRKYPFSALGRAVWDETKGGWLISGQFDNFQCSRSSRMG